jgi:hypothetical protein
MSKTELSGKQVKDGSVQRVDLDVSTSGQAVTTKIVAGDNISLSSTGVDAGTGDVTVSLGGTIASDITSLQSADTTLQANIDAEESARIAGDASTLASAQSYADTAVAGIVNDGIVDAKQYTETSVNAFDTALSPSSGTLTVDVSSAGAVFGALDASVTTWAFTNVPTDNSKVTTVTVVLDGNASYTYGDACSVNGTAITDGVMWQDGSAPASTDGMDMVTFVIAKDSAGTVKVFGYGTTNFS